MLSYKLEWLFIVMVTETKKAGTVFSNKFNHSRDQSEIEFTAKVYTSPKLYSMFIF